MNRTSFLSRFRQSLLPLPSLFGLAAIALSILTSVVDRKVGFEDSLFPGGADSARALLAAIAGASITLTAVVFSITMLVLQLTSAQYSPRMLRRFLRDRISQAALAVFVSTFTFSLAALRGVSPDSVPVTSVAIAVLLALLAIGVFVVYVNHMAQQIRVSSLIAAIAAETKSAFQRAYVDRGEGDEGAVPPWPEGGVTAVVCSPRDGVVLAVNERRLVAAARRREATAELVPRVGEWVVEGAPLLRVRGKPGDDGEALAQEVSVGDDRDMSQDPAYGIRQLVDIAERSLSPGTNDPTTAVQAIQAIHGLLARIAPADAPSPVVCDDDGTPRFRQRHRSFADVLDLSVNEILLYGGRSLQVTAALEHMLCDLLRVARGDRSHVVATKLDQVRRVRRRLLSDDAWFAAEPSLSPGSGTAT